jgi:hypothetical protein
MKLSIPCKICDRGSLLDRRIHRMSGPAVVIGYILLIPSLAAIAFCALFFIVLLFQPSQRYISARQAAIYEMRENSVPEEVITQVLAHPLRDPADYILDPGIPMVQYSWVKDATEKIRSGSPLPLQEGNDALVGRRLGEGFFIMLGIGAFVGGLLGWLLVMKKRVLLCSFCNAVVDAG